MNVFYHAQSESDIIILGEGESQHAVKVLRLNAGDRILVMDGKGCMITAEITNPHPKKCECKVLEKTYAAKRPFHHHIAIAPTKLNDRMEWFLEKATEIGLEEITPVICARSERRQVNQERLNKVLVAAMKQSMNPWLPVLRPQVDYRTFIGTHLPGFIAHCLNDERIPLSRAGLNADSIITLIGPEGDFTEAELKEALEKGWIPVSLGSTRLRTETAGVVACHTITLLKS